MTEIPTEDNGASGKPDRAVGLRPQPASQSSQSSIPSALLLLALTGCGDSYYESGPLYREAYTECMANLPEGPRRTTYNDWDEVQNGCRQYAAEVVHRTPAQAIETRRAETERLGAQHESAVGNADAPEPSASIPAKQGE